MDVKETIKLAYKAIEDKMGKDIVILDIRNVSVIADYFIIASGDNDRMLAAIADNVEETMEKAGVERRSIEGSQQRQWILMDYNDIIIHIFNNENRIFYNLEKIWRDGKNVSIDEI